MPSQLHESLITLFRNCPTLAPALLRDTLQISVPQFTEARIESAEFTEIQPAAYRADLVVLLSGDEPSLGIVLEVQLSVDEDKEYSWPVYVTSVRARNHCPVCLLVIAAKDDVARWARKPIALGGGNCFTPTVLSLPGFQRSLTRVRRSKIPNWQSFQPWDTRTIPILINQRESP